MKKVVKDTDMYQKLGVPVVYRYEQDSISKKVQNLSGNK